MKTKKNHNGAATNMNFVCFNCDGVIAVDHGELAQCSHCAKQGLSAPMYVAEKARLAAKKASAKVVQLRPEIPPPAPPVTRTLVAPGDTVNVAVVTALRHSAAEERRLKDLRKVALKMEREDRQRPVAPPVFRHLVATRETLVAAYERGENFPGWKSSQAHMDLVFETRWGGPTKKRIVATGYFRVEIHPDRPITRDQRPVPDV